MAIDLTLAPEVEFDITEGYLWYERRRVGLGEEFLSSVEACLERIRRHPAAAPMVHDDYRRALVGRFPYGVFYGVAETRVTVYAIFHNARDPEKWRHRLP
jgi:plasmid stabilization system protein ParE